MRPVGALLLVAALAAAGGPAAGAAEARKRRPGRFKIGPLYLTPRLELKNAGVDSNVFNRPQNPVGDTVVVLSPSMGAALPIGRRVRLTGDGFLDLNYFRRQGAERSTDFYGEGRAELDVGPFTLFGGGGGGQFRQRFSIELDQRLLRQEKRALTGAVLRVTRKLSLTGQGAGDVYRYEGGVSVLGDRVKDALDRNVLTGTLQLRYALTDMTSFVASADAVEDRFLSPRGDAPRTARSFRYMGGFELGERAILSGRVLAGIREFPSSNSRGAPAYRGPALSVDAALPVARIGRLAGLAERDVTYAIARGSSADGRLRNSFVSTRYQAELSLELPLELVGKGSFGFQEARYLLPYPRPRGPAQRRVDHVWSFGGSLLRRFGDSTRIGGTLAWVRRVSPFDGASFQGLRYGVQAEIVP